MNLKLGTKKKIISLFFVFVILSSCCIGGVYLGNVSGLEITAEGFAYGDGTSTSPWIIETPEQLNLIRNYLGTTHNDKYFKLGCDIDLTDYLSHSGAGWIPIGKETDLAGDLPGANEFRFTGTFDGDNYVIKNLVIDTVQSGAGLFGAVGTGGVVKNLGLVDGEVKGGGSVGGLVGYMNGGTIENCFTSIRVIGSAAQIGGLVGYAHSYRGANTIENCFSLGDVIGDGGVGGLVGYSWSGQGSTIKDCYATGDVIGNFYVGGLVGEQYSSGGDNNIIENCYATGDVTGIPGSSSSRSESIGGLVGRQNSMMSSIARINNCYATGSVSGGDQVGGLVGQQIRSTNMLSNTGRNNIANSYAMGDVVGHNFVGGLVGQQRIGDYNPINGFAIAGDGHNHILNCYATGSVTGNDFVGGLAGGQHKTSSSGAARSNNINNCYATGAVMAVLADHVGGLVGEQFGSACNIINSYFDTDATGLPLGVGVGSQVGVTGLSTEQMTEDDTLESGGAMAELGNLIWSKRAASSNYCYYPELAVFYGDGLLDTVWKIASELSVRVLTGEEPIVYEVYYDANWPDGIAGLGSVPIDVSGPYGEGELVTVLANTGDLAKPHYVFLGWAISDTATSPDYAVSGSMVDPDSFFMGESEVVLYAVWAKIFYTVTFDATGGVPVPEVQNVASGECDNQLLAVPQKAGYVFLGWFTQVQNGVEWNFNTPVMENIVLYAQWRVATYYIFYDLCGGINAIGNPTSYNMYSLPLKIDDPSRVGYVFQNWSVLYADGTGGLLSVSGIPVGTTGNVELTAIWVPKQFVISYHLNGGVNAANNPTTYTVESAFPIDIANPTKVNYDFQGWTVKYVDGSQLDITTPTTNYQILKDTTGDIELTANWAPKQYIITYNLNNGNNAPGNPTTYTVESAFPINIGNPTRSGYTFLGWTVTYANGTVVYSQVSYSIPAGTTGDIVLSANWRAVDSGGSGGGSGGSGGGSGVLFTVRFVDWDGTLLKNELVRLGGSATAPATPTREGYIFTGWDREFSNVRSDITVTAQYKPSEPEIIPPEPPIEVPTWALVNLGLSIIGIILAIIALVWILLQQKQKQTNQEQQNNSKTQKTTKQNNNQDKEKKQQRIGLFIAFAVAIAGFIVFLLTEDMSNKMTMIDKWTIVNVALFIVEIIAIALIIKQNKKGT